MCRGLGPNVFSNKIHCLFVSILLLKWINKSSVGNNYAAMGRTARQTGNKHSWGGVTFEYAGTDGQGRDRWKCHRCWNTIILTQPQTKHRRQGRVCLAHLALDTCSESGRQAHVEHRLVPTAGDAGVCIVATQSFCRVMKPKHFSQTEAATALVQCTPSWFVRTGTTFTKGPGKIFLNFAKRCVNPHCDKPHQQTIDVGQSHGLELAQKVGESLERRHGSCQGHTATAAAPETGEAFCRVANAARDNRTEDIHGLPGYVTGYLATKSSGICRRIQRICPDNDGTVSVLAGVSEQDDDVDIVGGQCGELHKSRVTHIQLLTAVLALPPSLACSRVPSGVAFAVFCCAHCRPRS